MNEYLLYSIAIVGLSEIKFYEILLANKFMVEKFKRNNFEKY